MEIEAQAERPVKTIDRNAFLRWDMGRGEALKIRMRKEE
jgi:hypothetical protein